MLVIEKENLYKKTAYNFEHRKPVTFSNNRTDSNYNISLDLTDCGKTEGMPADQFLVILREFIKNNG